MLGTKIGSRQRFDIGAGYRGVIGLPVTGGCQPIRSLLAVA